MGARVTIKQAATVTGLSEYALRKGIRERRYPHLRTGIGAGKIIIDVELLEECLRQEALHSVEHDSMPTANVIHYGQLRRVDG